MSNSDTTIVVGVNDTLADVLDRLRFATGNVARLEIPAGSALFLTANEFRALKDAGDGRGVGVTIESPDRLRLQLAGMFGFSTVNPAWETSQTANGRPPLATVTPLFPAGQPATRGKASARPAPTSKQQATAAPATDGASSRRAPRADSKAAPQTLSDRSTSPARSDRNPAAHPTWPIPDPPASPSEAQAPRARAAAPPAPALAGTSQSTSDVPKDLLFYAATHEFPARRSLRDRVLRRAAVPAPPKPRRSPIGAPGTERARDEDLAETSPARRRLALRRRTLAIIGVAVILAVVAALAAGYVLLPRATITLTLKSQPVHGEVVYAVTAPGQGAVGGADLTVVGAPFSLTVAQDASIATTGVRYEPQDPAHGSMRLSNPNQQPITVDKGTTVVGDNGMQYVVTDKVVVPAGNPAAGQYGRADVAIRAAKPGGVGNLATGELSGRLASGVYYSNREGPISGGSDKKIATVAPGDVQALEKQVAAALPQAAAQQAAAKVPAGQTLLPASVRPGNPTYTFDHQVGEDAAKLTLRATTSVTALAFNADEAERAAAAKLRDKLASQAPTGYALDNASLQSGKPVAVADQNGGGRFSLAADGQVRAIVSDAERAKLATQLVDKDAADAAAVLRTVPGVERFGVSYWPNWLPQRMPHSTDRIRFKTDG